MAPIGRHIILMLGALTFAACGESISSTEVAPVNRAPAKMVQVQDKGELLPGYTRLVVEVPTANSAADLKEASRAIKKRLKAFGFKKIRISEAADNNLNLIIRPDADIDNIREVLLKQSRMSFHLVDPASGNPQAIELAITKNILPAGTILRPYPERESSLIITERTRINQDCVKRFEASVHPETNRPVINFAFDHKCAKLFGKLTSENLGKRFAVLVDEVVITAPKVHTEILGGRGFIEGNFNSIGEVRETAALLETSRVLNGLQIVAETTIKE